MVFTSSANICVDFSGVSDHLDLSFTCCKLLLVPFCASSCIAAVVARLLSTIVM